VAWSPTFSRPKRRTICERGSETDGRTDRRTYGQSETERKKTNRRLSVGWVSGRVRYAWYGGGGGGKNRGER